MDAAHVGLAPFLGIVWGFQWLFIKAPSGRQRLNVLLALNASSHALFTVENRPYITSETVCELLRVLARTHQGLPITVILDNARYQRCALVQAIPQE
jgi:phosphopantetheine adenylyltransferase